MNLFELAAKITLDDTQFKKSVKSASDASKQVEKAFKSLQNPLDKTSDSLNKMAHPFETLKEKATALSHPFETLGNKIEESNRKIETQKNKLAYLTDKYETSKAKVSDLTKAFNKSAKESGITSKKTQELAEALDEAEQQANQAGGELEKYSQSVSGSGDSSEEAAEDAGVFHQGLEKISAWAIAKGQLVAEAIKKIAGAALEMGKSIIEVGANFEAQMSKVGAISGASAADMERLNQKAQEMGRNTKFTATEAGQAFEYMAMAGWKTEDMLGGIEGIMNLAAASGEELASVSDIVTDAMTAFGMSANESAHFADVLAKASSSSNTDVGKMGETFKYVAPVAGSLGYTIEDTAIAIGLMANSGIKASQAGTSLRAMLSRLASGSKPVTDAMAQLGMELTGNNSLLMDENGKMRDLFSVMLELRKAFANLGEIEKSQIAAGLAGQDAMSGLLAIVNASDDDFYNLTEAIDESDGAAEKMAEIMGNNLQGQMTKLSSATEGLELAIYEHVKGPLTEMAKWATDSVSSITNAFESGGLEGMVDKLSEIMNNGLNTMMEKVPEFADVAMKIILTLVDGIANGIPELIPKAAEVVAKVYETIIDHLDEILEAGLKLLEALAEGIINSIPVMVEKLPQIIGSFVSFILDHLPEIFDVGIELLLKFLDGIISAIPDLADAAIQMLDEICEGLSNGLHRIVDIGRDVVNKLKEGISSAWEGFKNWWTDLWNSVFGNNEVNVNINKHENLSGGSSGSGDYDGSHAGGLAFVPFDNYRANLHKGERVLTARENKDYNNNSSKGIIINQYIQTVPQTPAELAAATENYFREARWI